MRLLLVEDDTMIGESLTKALKSSYAINWVRDAETAELSLKTENYDLILLDLGLPNKSGIDFLNDLRKKDNRLPVLIITARDTIQERVIGLDAGADDYLVKPFDLHELEARMRVLLRRKTNRSDPMITHAGITLNPITHELTVSGKTEILSARTFALMQVLLEQPGAILSRAQLEERIYGWNEEVESNAVEVHIHSLRRKFGTGIIRNIRGVGYTIGNAA